MPSYRVETRVKVVQLAFIAFVDLLLLPFATLLFLGITVYRLLEKVLRPGQSPLPLSGEPIFDVVGCTVNLDFISSHLNLSFRLQPKLAEESKLSTSLDSYSVHLIGEGFWASVSEKFGIHLSRRWKSEFPVNVASSFAASPSIENESDLETGLKSTKLLSSDFNGESLKPHQDAAAEVVNDTIESANRTKLVAIATTNFADEVDINDVDILPLHSPVPYAFSSAIIKPPVYARIDSLGDEEVASSTSSPQQETSLGNYSQPLTQSQSQLSQTSHESHEILITLPFQTILLSIFVKGLKGFPTGSFVVIQGDAGGNEEKVIFRFVLLLDSLLKFSSNEEGFSVNLIEIDTADPVYAKYSTDSLDKIRQSPARSSAEGPGWLCVGGFLAQNMSHAYSLLHPFNP